MLAWAAEAEAGGGIVAELIVPADRDARVDWAEMVWIVFREYICFTADGGEFSVAVIGYD